MNIKSIFLSIAVIAATFPSMSQALSCRPLDAGTKIGQKIESGSNPVIVIGVPMKIEYAERPSILDLDRTLRRQSEYEPEIARYQILGEVLGTEQTQIIHVSYARHCVGPWCGIYPRTFRARTFILYEEEGTLHGNAGPCGGSEYPLPTPDQRTALENCLLEKKCGPASYSLQSRARPHR